MRCFQKYHIGICLSIIVCLFFNSCSQNQVKNDFPDRFSYKIIKEDSLENIHGYIFWNKIVVEINQKITKDQLAILSKKLFDENRRADRPDYKFRIVYVLPGYNNGCWATGYFEPDLKIEINGTTAEQDSLAKINAERVTDTITDDIVGKWHEDQFTSSNYILHKKEGKLFMKRIYSDLSEEEYELDTQKVDGEIRYYNHNRVYKYSMLDTMTYTILYSDTQKPGYSIQVKGTDYFTLNADGELLFSDSEGNFSKGTKF